MTRRAKPPTAKLSLKDLAKEMADLAAIPFDAAPDVSVALGTRANWLDNAEGQYTAMFYAAKILEKAPADLAVFCAEMGLETIEDVMGLFEATKAEFTGFAEALGCAHARLLIAMAATTLERA